MQARLARRWCDRSARLFEPTASDFGSESRDSLTFVQIQNGLIIGLHRGTFVRRCSPISVTVAVTIAVRCPLPLGAVGGTPGRPSLRIRAISQDAQRQIKGQLTELLPGTVTVLDLNHEPICLETVTS